MAKSKKNKTSFQQGNKYWQLREKHGRYKAYKPDELWEEACNYFEWIDENPAIGNDTKTKSGGKNGEELEIKTTKSVKPYTESGLQIYLGITDTTWENYCSGVDSYADFLAVTKMIKKIIYTQKFEGAAIGQFNANIIARDLGLTDKKDIKVESESLGAQLTTFKDLVKGVNKKKK